MVVQQERQMQMFDHLASERGQNNAKVCTHCGKNNHTIETSYFKHGFPTGYQSRNARTANTVTSNTFPLESASASGSGQALTKSGSSGFA